MNCKLCGYYYSKHEKGSTCGHCGGNREGLQKSRLMTISKIIVIIAMLLPVVTYIFHLEDFIFDMRLMSGMLEPEEIEGNSGAFNLSRLFYFNTLFAWIFAIISLFRVKKCNSVLLLCSAFALLAPAVTVSLCGIELVPAYTLPCLLYIAAAITARIDKKKQTDKYKKEV